MFQRNISPLSPGLKNKLSKKPLKCQLNFNRLHGLTSHKIELLKQIIVDSTYAIRKSMTHHNSFLKSWSNRWTAPVPCNSDISNTLVVYLRVHPD
jgi:hypothetical protein